MPADAEELGATVVGRAKARKPVAAAPPDRGRHGNGLDVRHGRGAAPGADVGGERRLEARLALLALERLDEGGLFAADVGAHPAVGVDVERVARAARVLSQEPRLVRLGNGAVERLGLAIELAAHVDVRGLGAHRKARNETPLDELVRVMTHDLAVLARPGLALVGVDDKVLGAPVVGLQHERPLEPGGEPSTATATEPRLLDLVEEPLGSLLNELFGLVPVAPLQSTLDARIAVAVEVRENAVLVAEPAIRAARRSSSRRRGGSCSRRRAVCNSRPQSHGRSRKLSRAHSPKRRAESHSK
eukprot:Amastigsp_a342364_35.p2 type:complete len:301 gc:universal Amastigsp_a342364_35:929-27(-)